MTKLLALLIIVILLIVGGVYYWGNPAGHTGIPEEGYSFARVERGTLVEAVNATGPLQPRQVAAVGSALTGKVIKVYADADYGRWVEKDQPLVELDKRLAENDLRQAQVAVRLAQENVQLAESQRRAAQTAYNRARQMLKDALAQRSDEIKAEATFHAADKSVDLAKIKVEEAQVALSKAQLGLDLTTVHAPISGVIIDKKVVQGQLIAPPASAHLFTVAQDLARMQVHAQVQEGDIDKVRPGLPATVTVNAYADTEETFQGRVEQIRPMPTSLPGAGPGGVSLQGAVYYPVIIDVLNRRQPGAKADGKEARGWMLLPGMTAAAEIRRREHKDVWKVPSAAVNFQMDEHFVTQAAKDKLAEWDRRKDRDQWRPVWILKDKKPWPIFVRIGGRRPDGQTGIHVEGQFYEGLEWDPELAPTPNPKDPNTYPNLIISTPPATKPGLFDRPALKIS